MDILIFVGLLWGLSVALAIAEKQKLLIWLLLALPCPPIVYIIEMAPTIAKQGEIVYTVPIVESHIEVDERARNIKQCDVDTDLRRLKIGDSGEVKVIQLLREPSLPAYLSLEYVDAAKKLRKNGW